MVFTDEQKEELLQHFFSLEFPKNEDPRPLAGKPIWEAGSGDLFQKAILEAFRYASIVQYVQLKESCPDIAEIFDYWNDGRIDAQKT